MKSLWSRTTMWPKTRSTTLSSAKKSSIVAQSSSITRTSGSGMLYRPRSKMMAQVFKGSLLAILSSLGSLRRRPGNRESSRRTHLTTMSCKMMIVTLQVILKSQTSRILRKSQLPSEGISESHRLQKKTPRTNQTNSVSIQSRTKGSITSLRPAGAQFTCCCTKMSKLEPIRKMVADQPASNRLKAITLLILLQRPLTPKEHLDQQAIMTAMAHLKIISVTPASRWHHK